MKRFFTMNIFFVIAAIITARFAVDNSFQIVEKTYPKILREKTIQKNLEITPFTIAIVEELLANSKKEIQKPSKVNSARVEKKFFYKAVDFTPNYKTEKEVKNNSQKVVFENVKKEIKLDAISTKNSIGFQNIEINKKELENIEIELSVEEISEQGAIRINKLNEIAWTKYALDLSKYKNLEIAETSEKRISNPETSTEVESTNKKQDVNFQPKVAKLAKEIEKDELIFFDYIEVEDEKEKVAPSKIETEKPVVAQTEQEIMEEQSSTIIKDTVLNTQSSIVSKVFPETMEEKKQVSVQASKETFKKKKVANFVPVINKVEPDTKQTIVENNMKNSLVDVSKNNNYSCLKDVELKDDENYQSNYELSLRGVDYSQNNKIQLRNFEIRFHDDLNEGVNDYGSGIINLSTKMSTQLSIRRSTFYRKGYYPTTMDLVFEAGNLKANVPVLSLDTFEFILKKYDLRGLGAHLLVELDDNTEDVELDNNAKYEFKLFLDKNLNIVTREDGEFYYILFIGVEAGNQLLKFKNSDNKEVTKIIFLAKDEIYYEPNFYAEVKDDFFYMYEEALLSNCYSLLNIKKSELEAWSFKGSFTKDSLNKYKINDMSYPLGIRKYYELKHLNESIFIGRWGQESIVVPSEKYIDFVISQFNLSQSNSKCVVQLNLNKPVSEIIFSGHTSEGLMNMQINILDSDGKFYKDFSEQSKRVFLMGEDQGVINAKIQYTDGSSQYLQSFCSDSTYLVEQL